MSVPVIEGFDARSWHRLVTLLAPGFASRAPYERSARAQEEGGLLLVIYRGLRVLKALHTHRGVVSLPEWEGRTSLETLAKQHGARFVIALDVRAEEELRERLGGRLHAGDDFTDTLLVGLGALRELYDEGLVHAWPALWSERVPLPTRAVLSKFADFVLPEAHCALVVLFADEQIDTALLLHRRDGRVDRVSGPEVLQALVGPLGGDFRRDARVLRAAVERSIGPVSVGIFAETPTMHTLLREGGWGGAIAAREVIFDPMPAWVAVAAGAGLLRVAGVRSRELLRRVAEVGVLGSTFERVRSVADVALARSPVQVLGFDPLAALAQVLQRSSPSGSQPTDEEQGE